MAGYGGSIDEVADAKGGLAFAARTTALSLLVGASLLTGYLLGHRAHLPAHVPQPGGAAVPPVSRPAAPALTAVVYLTDPHDAASAATATFAVGVQGATAVTATLEIDPATLVALAADTMLVRPDGLPPLTLLDLRAR